MTAAKGKAKPRLKVDWVEVEAEYRAAVHSVAEVARRHAVSRALIYAKAKKFGWTRDLAEAVRIGAERRLALPDMDTLTAENSRAVVEGGVNIVVEIVRTHRSEIKRLRMMWAESLAVVAGVLQGKRAAVTVVDEAGKVLDVRMPLLGERESLSEFMLRASHALSKLVPLERQSYGLEPRGKEYTAADAAAGEEEEKPETAAQRAKAFGEKWGKLLIEGPGTGAIKPNGHGANGHANGKANGSGGNGTAH